MDSPLRERLGTDEFKAMLDALNNDPTIGPNASGDGDIVRWYSSVCLLGIVDLSVANKNACLKPVEGYSIADGRWPGRGKFVLALADMGSKLFEEYFKSPSQELAENIQLHMDLIDIELAIRWGGRGPYVHKRAKVGNVRQKIREALANGIAVESIAGHVGVSRATVYRVLKEKN